ncbi:MAG: hypothetical protein ACYC3S_08920 [Chloroflexota bacterium]
MNLQVADTMRLAGSMAASVELAWSSYGWIIGLLLIAVLSSKEVLRAYGGQRTNRWMHAFNQAVVPLLVVFALAVVDRVLPLVLPR